MKLLIFKILKFFVGIFKRSPLISISKNIIYEYGSYLNILSLMCVFIEFHVHLYNMKEHWSTLENYIFF